MRGGFQVHSPMMAIALIAYALAETVKARAAAYGLAARALTRRARKPAHQPKEEPPTAWLLWRGGPGERGARAMA